MSSIQTLLSQVLSDPNLERRFTTAASPDELMALVTELGVDIELDELLAYFAGNSPQSELSDAELERVTGGASGSRVPVPPSWRS
jgi:predicted ribosomally synthesized peptide with nif11-like leader